MDPVVFILCGGRGTRLGARGTACPKVLTPVHGRPMLHHILSQLKEQGFRRFVFGIGYLADQVEAFVKKEFPDIEAFFSNAGDGASMLQRFHFAKDLLSDDFLVCYGDTFIDLDYQGLLTSHQKGGCTATIVTSAFKNPFGVVTFEPNSLQINSFHEKPTYHYYVGGLALKKNCISEIAPHLLEIPDGNGLIALFQNLISEGSLNSFPHQGLQVTFNTEGELPEAETALRTYYTLKETQ